MRPNICDLLHVCLLVLFVHVFLNLKKLVQVIFLTQILREENIFFGDSKTRSKQFW